MGSKSNSCSDRCLYEDVTMLVSEAVLGDAINKHVLPAVQQMLESSLQTTLEIAITKHMQSILLAKERRPSKTQERDALHNQSRPCEACSNQVMRRTVTKSHTVPNGKSSEDALEFQFFSKRPEQQTAACIDKLTMENVIRNAGLLDGESSSLAVLQSGVHASHETRNHYGQSSSLNHIVPATEEVQDCENNNPDSDMRKGKGRSESPGGSRVESSASYAWLSDHESSVLDRNLSGSQEGSVQHNRRQVVSPTSSDACSKLSPVSSLSVARRMNSCDGVVTLTSASGGRNSSKFRLYVIYAFFGIIRWSSSQHSRWYKMCICWVSACVAAFCVADLIQNPKRLYELGAQVAISVSSCASLASLENVECIIGGSTSFLGQQATQKNFMHRWSKTGMKRMVLIMVVWVCTVAAQSLKLYFSEDIMSIFGLCRCFVAVLGAGLHLVLIHCVGHALTFLEYMLDAYSSQFFNSDKWAHAVIEWNVVQSILHTLSSRVDSCFLAVQTSSAVVCLSCAAGIFHSVITKSSSQLLHQCISLVMELPTLMIALCAFLVFVKAASVTEICARIPPVMNSVKVDESNSAINHDRQYLVAFISQSKAGFRAKGSLIDATMLMNYCYVCGAIACGIFTTGLSMSRQ